MKKIIISLVILVVFASPSFADGKFLGAFSTPTIAGNITKMGSFFFGSRTIAGAVSDDFLRNDMPQMVATVITHLQEDLISRAKELGYNALINVKSEVTSSFSAHGEGATINGSDGIVFVVVTLTATPVFVK